MPNPFQPIGATANIAVTGTAQSFSLPTAIDDPIGLRQYVLTNVGTQTVFVLVSGTATTANGYPLLANTKETISLDGSVTALSVIAGSTGSTLYATAGFGE